MPHVNCVIRNVSVEWPMLEMSRTSSQQQKKHKQKRRRSADEIALVAFGDLSSCHADPELFGKEASQYWNVQVFLTSSMSSCKPVGFR